jgi:hypothetical protein
LRSATIIAEAPLLSPGGVAGGDGAFLAEGRLQPGQGLRGGVTAVVLVAGERRRALAGDELHASDLGVEMAGLLCLGEAQLGAQRPGILVVSGDAEAGDQVLGMPTRVFAAEGVVETIE